MRDLFFINFPEELLTQTNFSVPTVKRFEQTDLHKLAVYPSGACREAFLRCLGVEDLAAKQRSFVTDSIWSLRGAQYSGFDDTLLTSRRIGECPVRRRQSGKSTDGIVNLLSFAQVHVAGPLQCKSGGSIFHPLGAADHTLGLHGLGAGDSFRICIRL
jgi:hypothetical protein